MPMLTPARSLLTLLATTMLAAPAVAAPALWEVRDADSSIFVFGSFHILPENVQWRTELFDSTFASAETVVFETDIGPMAQAQIGASAFARGMYTDGTLLTDVIDDETEARLRAHSAGIDLPVGPLLAMRPWMAANTISVTALAGLGYGMKGVEVTLEPEIAAGKAAFLETGDQQLDVLAGAPEDEQIAMLESTLDQLDDLPKLMDKMVHHWLGGTPDQLGDIFLVEMGGFETAFMERLIYARNRNWIPSLEAMLAANEQALVIVGAAHLIGEGSVLDLLEDAGYVVERVQ
jgi:uncharacterized protein YbaP (TraB family)